MDVMVVDQHNILQCDDDVNLVDEQFVCCCCLLHNDYDGGGGRQQVQRCSSSDGGSGDGIMTWRQLSRCMLAVVLMVVVLKVG